MYIEFGIPHLCEKGYISKNLVFGNRLSPDLFYAAQICH